MKISTFKEDQRQVWKFEVSDYELVEINFTPKEKAILDKCSEPSASVSIVVAGLSLIAWKIEQHHEDGYLKNTGNVSLRK